MAPGRTETAVTPIHGQWLEALALRVRLNGVEWRVLAILLASPRQLTARVLTVRLRLDYALVKRTVRVLIGWKILERTPRPAAIVVPGQLEVVTLPGHAGGDRADA